MWVLEGLKKNRRCRLIIERCLEETAGDRYSPLR